MLNKNRATIAPCDTPAFIIDIPYIDVLYRIPITTSHLGWI